MEEVIKEYKMSQEEQERIFTYNILNSIKLSEELSLLGSEEIKFVQEKLGWNGYNVFYNQIPWFYLSEKRLLSINFLEAEDEDVYNFSVFASSDEEFISCVRSKIEKEEISRPVSYNSQSSFNLCLYEAEKQFYYEKRLMESKDIISKDDEARRKLRELIPEKFGDGDFEVPCIYFSIDNGRFVYCTVENGIPKIFESHDKNFIKLLKENEEEFTNKLKYMERNCLSIPYLEGLKKTYENDCGWFSWFSWFRKDKFNTQISKVPIVFLEDRYNLKYGIEILERSTLFVSRYKLPVIECLESNLEMVLKGINNNLSGLKVKYPDLFKESFFHKNILNQRVTLENIDDVMEKLREVAPYYYKNWFEEDFEKVREIKKYIVAACEKTRFENDDYMKIVDKRLPHELKNDMLNTFLCEIIKSVDEVEEPIQSDLISKLLSIVEPKVKENVCQAFLEFVPSERIKGVNLLRLTQNFSCLSEIDQMNLITYLYLTDIVDKSGFKGIFEARNPEEFKNEFEKLKVKMPSLMESYNEKKRKELQNLHEKKIDEPKEIYENLVDDAETLDNVFSQVLKSSKGKSNDEKISSLAIKLQSTNGSNNDNIQGLRTKFALLNFQKVVPNERKKLKDIAIQANNLRDSFQNTTSFNAKTKEINKLNGSIVEKINDLSNEMDESKKKSRDYNTLLNGKLSDLENKKREIENEVQQIDFESDKCKKKQTELNVAIKEIIEKIELVNADFNATEKDLQLSKAHFNVIEEDKNKCVEELKEMVSNFEPNDTRGNLYRKFWEQKAARFVRFSNFMSCFHTYVGVTDEEKKLLIEPYEKFIAIRADCDKSRANINECENKLEELRLTLERACCEKQKLETEITSTKDKIQSLTAQKQELEEKLKKFEQENGSKIEKLKKKVDCLNSLQTVSAER